MKQNNLHIPNSIGGEIAAIIEYPDESSDKLAVLCPGFLDTKDYAHLETLGRDLAEHGYTAVRFDPTGTWESSNSLDQYTLSQYLQDVRSVIDYASQRKAYTNVCIAGHSIGGLVSILYAAKEPRIATVVSIMSPYAYVRPNREDERGETSNWAKSGFHHSERDVVRSKEIRKFDVPYSFVRDSRQYNALDAIGHIHVPVLLIGGEKDEHVPPEYMNMLYERANSPKKIAILGNADHNYRFHPDKIQRVNQEILTFLKI